MRVATLALPAKGLSLRDWQESARIYKLGKKFRPDFLTLHHLSRWRAWPGKVAWVGQGREYAIGV